MKEQLQKHIAAVTDFHRAFGQDAPKERTISTREVHRLRFRLIEEELTELFQAKRRDDWVETLDALADLEYVVVGTIVSHGMGDTILSLLEFQESSTFLDSLTPEDMTVFNALSFYATASLLEDESWVITACLWLLSQIRREVREARMDSVFEAAFEEVHRSNMAKLHDGQVKRREDGKILKPEGWTPPNLEQFKPEPSDALETPEEELCSQNHV